VERSLASPAARPCIWMSAGLLQYRLCDRDFDCDRCPLDAALRGEPAPAPGDLAGAARQRPIAFPADRAYTRGHVWVQQRTGPARVGVDALAAALAGRPRAAPWVHDGATVSEGETLCALELPCGALPLASPLRGRDTVPNPALAGQPELVADDPYGAGWLLELQGEGVPAALLDAAAMQKATGLDLRHFRRRVGLELLEDLDHVGVTLADGGEALTDLRRMLGPRRYLALVRELVH
jgi:glycine cleavage system H protein